MEHLPKFRRKPKNPTVAAETKLATAVKQVDASSPKDVIVAQQKPKRSAFRALHLRGATKRARSPPPAALPQSPSHAVVTHDGVVEPSPSSRPPTSEKGGKATSQQSLHKAARIPSFLTLSVQGTVRTPAGLCCPPLVEQFSESSANQTIFFFLRQTSRASTRS